MLETTTDEIRINQFLNAYANKHLAFRNLLEKAIQQEEKNAELDERFSFLQIVDSLDKEMHKTFLELREFAISILKKKQEGKDDIAKDFYSLNKLNKEELKR